MILKFASHTPQIASDSYVADNATIVGSVKIGAKASVWFNAVIRADNDLIAIGAGTNIQDGAVLHTDAGIPMHIGARVTVGHKAVLHGCAVEDECLIGINAVILNRAKIGRGSLIAAGALITEGMEIPPGSLVKGIPGKVARALTPAEQQTIRDAAKHYQDKIPHYKQK